MSEKRATPDEIRARAWKVYEEAIAPAKKAYVTALVIAKAEEGYLALKQDLIKKEAKERMMGCDYYHKPFLGLARCKHPEGEKRCNPQDCPMVKTDKEAGG